MDVDDRVVAEHLGQTACDLSWMAVDAVDAATSILFVPAAAAAQRPCSRLCIARL